MSLAEMIYEEVRPMPEEMAQEVLDFVGYLKFRHPENILLCEKPNDDGDAWKEFEKFSGAWSGKFNREDCYDRPIFR